MIQKTIFILMLSCTGAGYFIGETEIRDSFPFINSEFHQAVKKKNIAKPKSFYSKPSIDKENNGSTTERFSFFPVLNDPSLSKMVGLNGEIIKNYDSSPISVRKAQSGQKVHRKFSTPVTPVQIKKPHLKVAVLPLPPSMPTKAEKTVERKNANQRQKTFHVVNKLAFREVAKSPSHVNIESSGTLVSYVVQVSAFRQWQHAETLRAVLGKKGYVSFIGKIELPDNRGTWYRVYIGRYFNRTGAEMTADRYYREENRKAMVVRQSG